MNVKGFTMALCQIDIPQKSCSLYHACTMLKTLWYIHDILLWKENRGYVHETEEMAIGIDKQPRSLINKNSNLAMLDLLKFSQNKVLFFLHLL